MDIEAFVAKVATTARAARPSISITMTDGDWPMLFLDPAQVGERAVVSALRYTSPMISPYVGAALSRARFAALDEGGYAATVHGLPGVIATGSSLEACRDQLAEIVEEWLLVRVSRGLSAPPLCGVESV